MVHRPWPYVARLSARMADSSLLDNMDCSTLARPPRSEGLHASELLHKLYPVKEWDVPITPEQLATFGMLGLAFEDRAQLALESLALESDWPWFVARPGEVMANGIACSPDILLVAKDNNGEQRELSIKTCWKSCKDTPYEEEGEDQFPKKFEYYIAQCQTYCVPLNTDSAILLCYFVCGDWRPPIPQLRGWELEFSNQEISENWDALTTIALEAE